MLQKLGYVEIGTLPGVEGRLASTIRTRYGGRHQSQDGLECKEPEVCPIQRVNAGLAARAAKWDGDKDWAGARCLCMGNTSCMSHICSCESWWEGSLTSFIKGGESPL